MNSLFLRFILLTLPISLNAQTVQTVNLVPNGDFEQGNIGFQSYYSYNHKVSPGTYAITSNAGSNNKDFKNPIDGDHASGRGNYFVSNANGDKGNLIWYVMVPVAPNTMYEFSAFICNIYKKLPPKTNFAFEDGDVKGNDPAIVVKVGGEVVAIEKDFYHLFRWVGAYGTWYSGTTNGLVKISIENLNTSISGNDLAIDDISFTYLETMPEGYEPPSHVATIVAKDYVDPEDTVTVRPRASMFGEFAYDSLGDGIYGIRPKYKYVPPYVPVQRDTNKTPEREIIPLRHIIFQQSSALLLPEAKKELDRIYEWLAGDTTIRVRFIGHTDNQGDADMNVTLSVQRVTEVKKYLVTKGINANRIETIGYGGAYPIADNSREQTRKLNRRVEMEILHHK